MKCYKHSNADASASCQSCGKSMCNECADRFTIIECEGCLVKNNASYSNKIKGMFVLSIALFILTFLFYRWILSSDASTISAGKAWLTTLWASYQAASIPFGWKLLNIIRNKINFGEWWISGRLVVLLWAIKVILAIVIGVIATPFMIFKSLKELKEMDSLKRAIQSGSIAQ